jgi:hypothetical protein
MPAWCALAPGHSWAQTREVMAAGAGLPVRAAAARSVVVAFCYKLFLTCPDAIAGILFRFLFTIERKEGSAFRAHGGRFTSIRHDARWAGPQSCGAGYSGVLLFGWRRAARAVNHRHLAGNALRQREPTHRSQVCEARRQRVAAWFAHLHRPGTLRSSPSFGHLRAAGPGCGGWGYPLSGQVERGWQVDYGSLDAGQPKLSADARACDSGDAVDLQWAGAPPADGRDG